jgi:hypothetical protein
MKNSSTELVLSSVHFLSRLLIIAAGIFILSMPAHAYEEDTHFQMTYVICRSVGFTADEALIVAAVDQGMDDSKDTVANGGFGGLVPHVEQEWMWHALDLKGKMLAAGIVTRRDQLFQDALKETKPRNKLIRLGVFFHYQQDTWAHRRHYEAGAGFSVKPVYDPNHLSRDSYITYSTPLGHSPDGHAPDRPMFDPVAALMNLEDGVVYARRFLQEGLKRNPGTFLAAYVPKGGKDDEKWSYETARQSFLHQIDMSDATATPNSARSYLLNLIRTQIETYGASETPNPRYRPARTPDQADLKKMRIALNKVCKDFGKYRSAGIKNAAIDIPTTDLKVAAGFTTMTTEMLKSPLK